MLYNIAFAVAFTAQIVVISLYFPGRLRRLARGVSLPASSGGSPEPGTRAGDKLRRYAIQNGAVAAIGVVLLALFFTLDLFRSLTALLAAVGIFFALQVSPLAALGLSGLTLGPRAAAPRDDRQEDTSSRPVKMLDIVSPLQMGAAVALFVAYVLLELLHWNGEMNKQLLKIGIFAVSNVFIVALIARRFRAYKRGPGVDGEHAKRYQALKTEVPALMLVSIGVSVYSLGKQLLIDLDLHQMRPIMMSVFLVLLASLSFDRQLRDAWRYA